MGSNAKKKSSKTKSSQPSKKSTQAKPAGKEQAAKKKTAPAKSKPAPSKVTAPAREPWTPWGKWAKKRRERKEKAQREREKQRMLRKQARQRRRMRRRLIAARGVVFVGLLVLACSIMMIVFLVLGHPYPWESLSDMARIQRLSRQIDEHQARWESLSIPAYSVEIEYTDDEDTWCGPVIIEVQDGAIVDPPSPQETHWFPEDTCDELFDNFLISPSYDWLADQLATIQPGVTAIDMTFDPDFGYPTYAESIRYHDTGADEDCCWQITWNHLRLIYDE